MPNLGKLPTDFGKAPSIILKHRFILGSLIPKGLVFSPNHCLSFLMNLGVPAKHEN